MAASGSIRIDIVGRMGDAIEAAMAAVAMSEAAKAATYWHEQAQAAEHRADMAEAALAHAMAHGHDLKAELVDTERELDAEREAHATTRQLGNIHCLEQDAHIGELELRVAQAEGRMHRMAAEAKGSDERAQAWFEQAERLSIELADCHEELRAVRSVLDGELHNRRVAEYLLELCKALYTPRGKLPPANASRAYEVIR